MRPYELEFILENLNYTVRNEWEMTREIMWSNMSPWSKKKLKVVDIMKLPWDNKNKQQAKPIEVTEKLRDEMMKKAQASKEALIASGIL